MRRTKRLIRGEVTPSQMGRILDELGVRPGQEFQVTARAAYSVPDARTQSAVLGSAPGSRDAARAVRPRAGTQRWQVLVGLYGCALTRAELARRTGLNPNSLRPRVLEAIDGGWVEQAANRGGREVLRLTDAGRALVEEDARASLARAQAA